MKKTVVILLALLMVFSVASCASSKTIKCPSCGEERDVDAEVCIHCGKSTSENETTAETTPKTKYCSVDRCGVEVTDSPYCEEHLSIYEFERSFYSVAKLVIDSLEDYHDLTNTPYELKEVIVFYRKPTEAAIQNDPYSYYKEQMISLFVYYEANGVECFEKYLDWQKYDGVTPTLEKLSTPDVYYGHRSRATKGASADGIEIKIRDNHFCAQPNDIYEEQHVFLLDLTDYYLFYSNK